MSCIQGSSPINVTETKKTCSSTCHYSYTYGLSNLTVENKNDHLSLSYDANTSKVSYNTANYKVEDIRIYKPSLNKYNNTHYDAELIIHHTSDGANNLLVCVPIQSSNRISQASELFKNIIAFAPPKNQTTSINVSNYTLNHFIPRGGYYAYVGNLPYQPCNGTYDILLFDPKLAIDMRGDDLSILGTLIERLEPITKNINPNELYYNKDGTMKDGSITYDDDIYIKCTALDEDGNEVVGAGEDGNGASLQGAMTSTNETGSFSPSKKREQDIMNYVTTSGEILGGVILMYALYRIGRHIVNKLSEE